MGPSWPDGRRDFGQHLDRRGIVRKRKSRQLVLQAAGLVRSARGGVARRLREIGLGGRRDGRQAQQSLQDIAVEATAGSPDRRFLQRCSRRNSQPQRIAALHGVTEYALAGTHFIARPAHAQRLVAGPDELAAHEPPSGRQGG